jgi:hypothetical protein
LRRCRIAQMIRLQAEITPSSPRSAINSRLLAPKPGRSRARIPSCSPVQPHALHF